MAAETRNQSVSPHLVAKIIASYVSHHSLTPDQIPELIAAVHRSINELGQQSEQPEALTPAVPVRRSVQRDAVTCLDCGWKGKMLRRHLTTQHGLSGDEYLKRWNLPGDHPLTAPNYSAQRSSLAKELGLGRGNRSPDAPSRGRRSARASGD
jgi:predicted transcriptional regulator